MKSSFGGAFVDHHFKASLGHHHKPAVSNQGTLGELVTDTARVMQSFCTIEESTVANLGRRPRYVQSSGLHFILRDVSPLLNVGKATYAWNCMYIHNR